MNLELLYNIFGIIHIITCFLLIVFVLFQKTTGDGLFAASSGGNSFMSGVEIANFLTVSTKYLGIFFLINTVFLATLSVKISSKTKIVVIEEQTENSRIPSTSK